MSKRKSTKAWSKFPDSIAVKYWRDIKPVTDRIKELYKKIIEPELLLLLGFEHVEVPDISMDDAVTEKIGKLFRTFRVNYYGQSYPLDGDPKTKEFRRKLELQVDKSAKAISRIHKSKFDANARFVLSVDPLKSEPWLRPYLQDFTTQNVSLIKGIPEFAVNSMEQMVTGSVLRGDSKKFLTSQIVDLLGISETRAKRIARDQSNKMYGTLTELRANFNGWNFYEWNTSNDSKVRSIPETNKQSDHARLDGKIYKFSEPPITVQAGKRAGERNNPGQDIQCRCAALIIFDQAIISQLKKQSDGSYKVPALKAA